jgi:hypothetical protein
LHFRKKEPGLEEEANRQLAHLLKRGPDFFHLQFCRLGRSAEIDRRTVASAALSPDPVAAAALFPARITDTE